MDALLLHRSLSLSAERSPARPLLLEPDRIVTYAEAERRSDSMAHLLRRLGVAKGERVAFLARNSLAFVESYYGILKAGAVAVPINTAIDARGLRYQLENCGARGLLHQRAFSSVVSGALQSEPELPELRLLLSEDPDALEPIPAALQRGMRVIDLEQALGSERVGSAPQPGSIPFEELKESDPAAIIYTSGSTGRPRGAVLTHKNLVSNTRSIVQYLELTEDDRMLVVLPFFYVYGLSLLQTHVWAGGSLIVGTDLLFPNDVVTRMTKDSASGLAGVPSTFAILLNRSKLAQAPPATLRYLTQAGGAMAPALTRRLIEALPQTKIFIMYGATEASARLTYLPPSDLDRKLGSIGKAIPGISVRVLRDDGSEAPPGETGELVAQGDNIMAGYWGDPEETARVLGPEGLHTGDLGYRDEDGYLYLVGRKTEMIKCGANRISPLEIEEMLLEHPSVHEAAVFGVPDELLGEAIVAFVAPREGCAITAEEMISFASSRLPEYKVPTHVRVRRELPKSEAGKIRKQRLRDEWNLA